MRPFGVPPYIAVHNQPLKTLWHQVHTIRERLQRFSSSQPEVSIIIPAYNEQDNILKTLSSLSAAVTRKSFEVIVVNNNSQDDTALLASTAGAICVEETVQGITHARNAGLQRARGRFVLNADADTIYPPAWIDAMTSPLYREDVVLTYGSYAFLPSAGNRRVVYYIYEYIAHISKWRNGRKEEAVNVYGFNSAFCRLQGMQVKGFDHPPGTNEDGWLAVKLRNTFSGRLYFVPGTYAMPWTSDRRIKADGGLLRGMIKRLKRHV